MHFAPPRTKGTEGNGGRVKSAAPGPGVAADDGFVVGITVVPGPGDTADGVDVDGVTTVPGPVVGIDEVFAVGVKVVAGPGVTVDGGDIDGVTSVLGPAVADDEEFVAVAAVPTTVKGMEYPDPVLHDVSLRQAFKM